jgi:thioredoxin reductase (NADPH)
VHRRSQLGDSIKYWVRPDIENRIREGSIRARFDTRVREIRPECVIVESNGNRDELPAQGVFLLTGYHPDSELLRRAGVEVNEETFVPTHNPETLETNVPGLYLAGAVVTGKETNRVFIENGRFHGDSVVAAIRARLER